MDIDVLCRLQGVTRDRGWRTRHCLPRAIMERQQTESGQGGCKQTLRPPRCHRVNRPQNVCKPSSCTNTTRILWLLRERTDSSHRVVWAGLSLRPSESHPWQWQWQCKHHHSSPSRGNYQVDPHPSGPMPQIDAWPRLHSPRPIALKPAFLGRRTGKGDWPRDCSPSWAWPWPGARCFGLGKEKGQLAVLCSRVHQKWHLREVQRRVLPGRGAVLLLHL